MDLAAAKQRLLDKLVQQEMLGELTDQVSPMEIIDVAKTEATAAVEITSDDISLTSEANESPGRQFVEDKPQSGESGLSDAALPAAQNLEAVGLSAFAAVRKATEAAKRMIKGTASSTAPTSKSKSKASRAQAHATFGSKLVRKKL